MALPSNAHLIWHPFVGVCRHQELAVGLPVMVGYIDFGVVNGVTGLFAWPTGKFSFPPAREPDRGGIRAWGAPMEGCGTDSTLLTPHIPVKPPVVGALLALTILMGTSRIVMGSNRTRIWCKGLSGLTGEVEKAVGCCVFPYVPLSLNLQCWDFPSKKLDLVSAPVMSDVVIAPNTVQVGIEFSDYLSMLIDWAIDVALAFLFAFGTKKANKLLDERSAKKLAAANKAADEAYEKAIKAEATEEVAKAARSKVFAEKTASILPKKVTQAWDKFAAKPGATKWLAAVGGKVPYKLLIKNTEWYREGVERPISDEVQKLR